MPSTVEDGDGEKESNATRSLLTGPQPEFCGYQSADEEQAALEEWLKERQTEGMALHEIALFARSSRCLKERAIPALQNAKCAFQKLSTEGVPEPDQVVVGSFHGAKGLEFRAVAIVGCDHDQVPLRTVVRRIRDAAERDDFIEQERHLLYVACTRARERLRVSWSGKGCEWLGIEKPKAEIMDQSKAKELGPQYSKDDAFTKRMRLHQSWYRSQVLGVPYGKGPTKNAKNYFGNMLTAEDADTGKNFLSSAIHKYAEQRMTQGEGAVEPYRLLHNMLSSQPMCFNLFGPLHDDLEMATTLVQAVWGDHIAKVTRVDVEWAPTPKDEYLDDKTAFDAFIEYETTSGDLGFIGIETKLTEPFSKKHVDKESYRRWMTAGSPWKPESAGAVADVKHNQLWRDHLLAWAMLRHPKTKYAEGSLAVVYHSQDARCAEVLEGYRGLLQSEGTLQAFTLEQLVAAWRPLVGESQWLRDFAVRYLELEGSDRRTG